MRLKYDGEIFLILKILKDISDILCRSHKNVTQLFILPCNEESIRQEKSDYCDFYGTHGYIKSCNSTSLKSHTMYSCTCIFSS